MPTIIVINGLRLCIYGDDHAPPHFHLLGPNGHFLVDLRSFSILEGGRLPQSYRAVMDWAKAHQDDLLTKWSDLNERG